MVASSLLAVLSPLPGCSSTHSPPSWAASQSLQPVATVDSCNTNVGAEGGVIRLLNDMYKEAGIQTADIQVVNCYAHGLDSAL